MSVTPEVGWIVSVQFTDQDSRGFVAEAGQWAAAEEFLLKSNHAPAELEVGDRWHVQVNKVVDDTVRVLNYNQGRNDQLLPGGSLVVEIETRSKTEYSVGRIHSFPFVDTVRIYGETPASMLSIPIDAVAPMDSFAVSDVSNYQWPAESGELRVFTNQGQSTVRSLAHQYEFPIENRAPVTGIARVEARYDDMVLRGRIREFETNRPEVGETVTAYLDHSRAENVAWFGDYDDRIVIDGYPPISGPADVRITQAEHPLECTVIDGPDSVPDVGDVISAYVTGTAGEAYAKPEGFDARIRVAGSVAQSGFADIEITELGESITGEIQSFQGTPTVGDRIEVEVSRGSAPVTGTSASGAAVRIEHDVLVSGTVDVEITNDSLPLQGVVDSYRDLIPDVGELIRGTVDPGVTLSTARPDHGKYVVYLPNADDYEGRAVIEVTAIDDCIDGQIVERNPVDQSVGDGTPDSPFGGDRSAWNITRKKR